MSSEIVIKKYSLDLAFRSHWQLLTKALLSIILAQSQFKVADQEIEVIIIWFEKCA